MQKITQNDLNLVKNGDPINAQTLNKTIISLLQELGDLQNQNSVNKGQLQEKSVTWDTIDDNSILEQHLRDDSISQSKLQDNSVIQGKLGNESVFEENIRAQAVTEQKIQNDSVNNNQLKTNSVSTIKIQDSQVTEDKLQSNSISTDKIQNKAVTLDKIQDYPPESILARRQSTAGAPQFITKEQLKDMLEIGDMNSIVIGEEEGNILRVPSFGIGQGSEMFLGVIRDVEEPEDQAALDIHDQEIPEDQNYDYDYQNLTELQGGMYQIHREHPQNPLNQNQTLIITRHKEGSQTLIIQGVQTPEMKIQVWTGSSLTWDDVGGVKKYVFTKTIQVNSNYVVNSSEIGNQNPLDVIVNIKVKDTYPDSVTYNKYINGDAAITCAFEANKLTFFNELDVQVEVRILIMGA